VQRIRVNARLVGSLDQILFCRIREIAFRARTILAGLSSFLGLPGEPLFGFFLADGAEAAEDPPALVDLIDDLVSLLVGKDSRRF
jgi:hypothetical protein